MREAGTGRFLGTMQLVDDVLPGAVVRRFRADEIQLEVAEAEQPRQFIDGPGVHDQRGKGNKPRRQKSA